MFDISYDGIIRLSRGDTANITLFINQGTKIQPIRYYLKDNDILYFAISEPNQLFEDAIVKKIFTTEDSTFTDDGDLIIKINSIDTEYLRPGTYYYEVKLRTNDVESDGNKYQVNTIISRRKFIIEE